MELKILGAFEVFHEGRPLPLAGAKPKAVLAILPLHANEVVSSDRLAEELWSRPPDTARATLQVYVAQLRKLFDPDRSRGDQGRVLLTRSPGYLLEIAPDQLDAQRFERLLGEGPRAAGDTGGRGAAPARGPFAVAGSGACRLRLRAVRTDGDRATGGLAPDRARRANRRRPRARRSRGPDRRDRIAGQRLPAARAPARAAHAGPLPDGAAGGCPGGLHGGPPDTR